MIKLKHKQSGMERLYSATVWFGKNYDISVYDIIEWYDVVELFHNKADKISAGKMEKKDAIIKIDTEYYIDYWFEDVPRPDLEASLLPINTPRAKTPIVKTANINPAISKAFKNDYIKYTIIGVTVSIIVYFAYEYFKYKHW